MNSKPQPAAFSEKMERVRQLLDQGRVREAVALALAVLEEEVRLLERYFQALQEKLGRRPRPPSEPQDYPGSSPRNKPRNLH